MTNNSRLKVLCLSGLALGGAVSAPTSASTTNFSFQGNFTADNVVSLYNFYLSAAGTVTFRSYGFAGGAMLGDGSVVSAGGFDSNVAIFDATGVLLAQNDDGNVSDPAPCNIGTDPATGMAFDFCLQQALAAGVYTLAVTQSGNWANGPDFVDGFSAAGDPQFTGAWCTNGQFCDSNGDNRTNHFAFDILGADFAATPAPATLALLGPGLFGLRSTRRRYARS